jgi:hypothetical protein
MNSRHFVLLLCVLLLTAAQAKAKTVLPDACGDDSIKFDMKTEKNQPAPAGPADGKAQIVFIESVPQEGPFVPSVRYGVDGSWAGANKGNSYFVLNVDPGTRHICVSAQGVHSAMAKDFVDMATLTAEAGKVYYFEAAFNVIGGRAGGGVLSFGLSPLDEDTGKYRVKAWKLATWKTNK